MIARFAFDMIVFAFHLSDKRLTAGVTRLGWERGLAVETGQTQSQKPAEKRTAYPPSSARCVGRLSGDRTVFHNLQSYLLTFSLPHGFDCLDFSKVLSGIH